jgi:hypothetical protein
MAAKALSRVVAGILVQDKMRACLIVAQAYEVRIRRRCRVELMTEKEVLDSSRRRD